MKSRIYLAAVAAFLTGFLLLPASVWAQKPSGTAGRAVMTVTAVGKKDALPQAISRDEVQLTVSKERKQIAAWNKEENLYLAILIDDALDPEAAGQWNELKAFISEQPAKTAIAVGYADNASVILAQDFTTDHALAAKALRIPRGAFSAGSSPYLSVVDWIKRWPDARGRRSLLLISSGIDYFRGPGFGPVYPDVDTAISLAQKGNINLWSIFYPGFGHRGRSFFLLDRAQLNLSKLTLETGGESFYQGFGPPVSIKPFLDELQTHLSNQYVLSFAGDGGKKGRFVSPGLKTELSGVEFLHANQAYLPPAP